MIGILVCIKVVCVAVLYALCMCCVSALISKSICLSFIRSVCVNFVAECAVYCPVCVLFFVFVWLFYTVVRIEDSMDR